jgi:flavorubredoxin
VPHGWEAGVFYDAEDRVLFCGDLFTHVGDPAPLTEAGVLEPAIAAEAAFGAMTMAPQTAGILRELAALEPKTLALMHGSSFTGDAAAQLQGLADWCEGRARPHDSPA